VIVLLKLLLATVTANNSSNLNNGGGHPDSGNGQPSRLARPPNDGDAADLQRWLFADEPPELNLEDTDIMRHREITSKAVSAILITLLKWFKTSRKLAPGHEQVTGPQFAVLTFRTWACSDVMKFHYLSQLLVDSNCLLLILKMFGLQEVSTLVKTKNERASHKYAPRFTSSCPPRPSY